MKGYQAQLFRSVVHPRPADAHRRRAPLPPRFDLLPESLVTQRPALVGAIAGLRQVTAGDGRAEELPVDPLPVRSSASQSQILAVRRDPVGACSRLALRERIGDSPKNRGPRIGDSPQFSRPKMTYVTSALNTIGTKMFLLIQRIHPMAKVNTALDGGLKSFIGVAVASARLRAESRGEGDCALRDAGQGAGRWSDKAPDRGGRHAGAGARFSMRCCQ
jgi:hypothetical protein